MSQRRGPVTAGEVLSAKQALLSHGLMRRDPPPRAASLPEEIERSWRRSIGAGAVQVAGAFPYVNAFDADSKLIRASAPILDRLEATLQDLGTAIFLADRSGQIVARRVPDRSEQSRFDNACAAEGFDFSEERIGTNGLGTAMEEDDAIFVRGPEHFNEALEHLACAGAGIRHPATGRLMGSLSLAASAEAAERTMLALVREGARQIMENLNTVVDRREIALGRWYRQHRTRGPVIVLDRDTVMTNVTGLSLLSADSHASLWESLLTRDWSGGPQVVDLELDGLAAQVVAHRLDDLDHDEPAFGVELQDRSRPTTTRAAGPTPEVHDDHFVAHLRSTAGSSGAALSVTGPSGSGKLHTTLEWLRLSGHPEPVVLDAGELDGRPTWRRDARTTLDGGGAVVLRRLEDLPERHLNAVKALSQCAARHDPTRTTPLRDHDNARSAWFIVTADPSRCAEAVRAVLAPLTVGSRLPALAQRREDLPALIDRMLAGIDGPRRPVLSAATMQVLGRWDWPGNLAELRSLIDDLARRYPGACIAPHHLPDHLGEAATRRALTRIESAERSEIVAALRQADGNRSEAARLLGIGRTTLYRKLDALRIEVDALLLEPQQPTDG